MNKEKNIYVLTQNCRITSVWLNKLVCSGALVTFAITHTWASKLAPRQRQIAKEVYSTSISPSCKCEQIYDKFNSQISLRLFDHARTGRNVFKFKKKNNLDVDD